MSDCDLDGHESAQEVALVLGFLRSRLWAHGCGGAKVLDNPSLAPEAHDLDIT